MKIFAAIYIGSHELSMKIYELVSKKEMRQVDFIRRRIGLGRDVYGGGSIGYQLADEICDALREFAGIMKSYQVDDYRVYAGQVFHDAQNGTFVLDQIELRTGFQVEVLYNSEHRFISYKALASRKEFDEMTKQGAAVVDIGGGSIQITVFQNGNAITSQHLMLGTMRVREKLSSVERLIPHVDELIQELVDKDLRVFQSLYLKDVQVKYVILIGDYIVEIRRQLNEEPTQTVKAKQFINFLEKLSKKGIEEIADQLNLSNDHDPLVVPALILYKRAVEALGASEIYVPGISINDGIAYAYAQDHSIFKASHDFDEDVISLAKNMARRYLGYSGNTDALTDMTVLLFDAMKKVHGMGKREKLLLKTAAILKDCGQYISIVNAAQCAYHIVMASEIIGLTHLEREIVARTILYNTTPLDPYEKASDTLDRDSYLIVAKLAAILRLATSMERSYKRKYKNVKANLTGRKLVITIESEDNMILERGLFATRQALFEEVFSIKPVIKAKRIY